MRQFGDMNSPDWVFPPAGPDTRLTRAMVVCSGGRAGRQEGEYEATGQPAKHPAGRIFSTTVKCGRLAVTTPTHNTALEVPRSRIVLKYDEIAPQDDIPQKDF